MVLYSYGIPDTPTSTSTSTRVLVDRLTGTVGHYVIVRADGSLEAPPVRAAGLLMEAASEFLSSCYSYVILDIIVDNEHTSI